VGLATKRRRIKRADLLQFSGDTSGALVKGLVKVSKDIKIRVLIASEEQARKYNVEGTDNTFHIRRIDAFLGQMSVLHRDYPSATIGVWSYNTDASIAGVMLGASARTEPDCRDAIPNAIGTASPCPLDNKSAPGSRAALSL